MKIRFLHFFKLTLALLLFLQVEEVSAQNITVSGGSPLTLASFNLTQACGNVTGAAVGGAALSNSSDLTVTSDVFVTSMSFIIGSVNVGDGSSFDALGITNEVVSIPSTCTSLFTLSGNSLNGLTTSYDMVRVTVSSVTPFKQVKISISNYSGSPIFLVSGTTQVTAVCNAGTTAPVPTVTTIANVCPATTVSLPTTNSGPTGTTVKWFTNNAHTGTAVADATQAPAGTYYAFYYDATNNCYSPASAAVTATVSACCPTTSPTVN